MNKTYILFIYVLVIISIVLTIGGIMKVVRNENFITYRNAAPSKMEFVKKNEKNFDLVIKFLFFVGMGVFFINLVIPGVLDIPNVVNGQYYMIEGTAVTSAGNSNRAFPKIVTIKSAEGKEVRVRFYSTFSISKGDKLKVVYLPNLKRGTLLNHTQR